MGDKEQYKGQVLEVFSGDDLIVLLDLGVESLFKRVRVRLYGVDTPNGVGCSADTEAGRVRRYVQRVCHKSQQLHFTVINKAATSWIVVLEAEDNGTLVNLNQDLIAQGYQFKREKVNER